MREHEVKDDLLESVLYLLKMPSTREADALHQFPETAARGRERAEGEYHLPLSRRGAGGDHGHRCEALPETATGRKLKSPASSFYGQHEPAQIPQLQQPIQDGTADIVIGYRELTQMPRLRLSTNF